MNRDQAFGRLLAIANVLGERVFEKGKPSPSQKYWDRFARRPVDTFTKMHAELMEYAHKFGPDENHLMDLFGEILSEMNDSEFTNEPLAGKYLQGYYSQQHVLNNVMGAEEAAELWGLSPGTIKNYCAEGRVRAKKLGRDWAIDKNQENPKKK